MNKLASVSVTGLCPKLYINLNVKLRIKELL